MDVTYCDWRRWFGPFEAPITGNITDPWTVL